MASCQRGLVLCRSGQRSVRASNATIYLSSVRRRWQSSGTATASHDSTVKGESFHETVSHATYTPTPNDSRNNASIRRKQAGPRPVHSQAQDTRPTVPESTRPVSNMRNALGSEEGSKPFADAAGRTEATSSETATPGNALPKESSSAVHVALSAGESRQYDPIFLRDCCTCPKCVDSSTRQKLFSTTDISADIRVKDMWSQDDVLHVTWTGDLPAFGSDHVTSIPHEFLTRSVVRKPVRHYKTGKHLWTAKEFQEDEVTFDYAAYMSDDKVFFDALRQLQKYGLVFVQNVPEKEASVSDIATRIGPLKNTFYGSTWDVRSVAEAKNVAYTSQDLGFHMDLLYMHQPPRIQLLHCLKASTAGGTSLFSDSYLAAQRLLERDRQTFDTLAEHDVNFHYDNDSQHYHQSRRVLQLAKSPDLDPSETKTSVQGLLDAVNWSPPFQGPFHNTAGDARLATHVRRWHAAAQAFRDLVEADAAVYQRQMPPGECVIFDNRRVLHARTAFSGGERWLRGCYLDSDPLHSKMRVLERQHGAC